MQRLETLLAHIMAALTRGGSGAARQEADQQVVHMSGQGMSMARETLTANEADFAHHFEEWNGTAPDPRTPREDPHHAAKARMGRMAERFLLALKVAFWTIFGPVYFNVLAWIAVIIALCISITVSLGVKPLLAGLILKPGLTPHQKERRLHKHVVAGIIAFAIAFGALFLLRGLAGPLAVIGALLVLPVLSLCDLVLLYLMGIAHACVQLYGWAAPFVRSHHEAAMYRDEFERHREAAQRRLENPNDNVDLTAALPEPTRRGPSGAAMIVPSDSNKLQTGRASNAGSAAMLVLAVGLMGALPARSQAPASAPPAHVANLELDSTTSLYPSVMETITPVLVRAFTGWVQQARAQVVRVTLFERDGWLPRTVTEIIRNVQPSACAASQLGERSVFRSMSEALEKQARVPCEQAKATDADRIRAELHKAVRAAWHASSLVNASQGRSCTAFLDALAAAAIAPAGSLISLVSDSEETCKIGVNPVPGRSAGAHVIVILLPSRADMGPGVSAAGRFAAKKGYLQRVAPG